MKRIGLALSLFAVLLLGWGCKTPKPLGSSRTEGFKPSKQSIDTLLLAIDKRYAPSDALKPCFEGKSRVAVQSTEEQQSGVADFIICQERAYFRLKNRLGIEAYRAWKEDDRLFLRDLINRQNSQLRAGASISDPLQAFANFEIFPLLRPSFSSQNLQLYEDQARWMIVDSLNNSWLFDKETLDLQSIIGQVDQWQADRMYLQRYGEMNGLRIPSRMEFLNSRAQTNIFVQISRIQPSEGAIPSRPQDF